MKRKPAPYAAALAYANEKDHNLTADRFLHEVTVTGLHDGMVCIFPDAISEEWKGWLIVYTEHYGPHLFIAVDKDEIRWSVRTMQERMEQRFAAKARAATRKARRL